MKNRYDGAPSQNRMIANVRQKRFEEEHDSKNAFVKRQEDMQKNIEGKAPNMKEESMNFNAYMCNNGMHAQEFARDLTTGLDKKAFPLK